MDFDYLNNDIIEWADAQEGLYDLSPEQILTAVRDHYLPEFEAAIWKLAAANAK